MPDAHSTLCLGSISGPLLIFGGPYSNSHALEALRQEAKRLGIPPEHCICTGDIVAYCAQPTQTVAAIRDWGIHCLMGNCEESFANNTNDCGCGFAAGTQCDILSAQWFNFANTHLNNDARQWFASLPRSITFELNGIASQVVHGSPSSINRFMFASTSKDIFRQELALSDAELIIGGHCGIPFTRCIDGRLWHNAGAIGMPANDGSTHTWFSILDTDNSQLSVTMHELHYDASSAHQAMLDANMNNGYAKALITGLWPSMDVLPIAEQAQQGQPLQTQQLIIERASLNDKPVFSL